MGGSAYAYAKLRERLDAEGISDTLLDSRLDTIELAGNIDSRLDTIEAAIAAAGDIDSRLDALEAAGGGGAAEFGAVVAHKTAGQTGIADITNTVVTWDAAAIDPNGWMDLANDRFLPDQPGIFLCYSTINCTAADATELRYRLRKNGLTTDTDDVMEYTQDNTNNFVNARVLMLFDLDGVDDYVDASIRADMPSGTLSIGSSSFDESCKFIALGPFPAISA